MSKATTLRRYETATEEKAGGVTYTPKPLADFVARQILQVCTQTNKTTPLRILDPAVGHGELLISIVEQLRTQTDRLLHIYGFETDDAALATAVTRLRTQFSNIEIDIQHANFLEYVVENFNDTTDNDLFQKTSPEKFDLIIANPPYVRTQIMGGKQAQLLTEQFNLSGRVDLYHAFILGMSRVLATDGVAGIIVSNRFMTTRSGASVRTMLRDKMNIQHVWDLGDTKLFDVAVLPAVLLLAGKQHPKKIAPIFTSIYATQDVEEDVTTTPLEAVTKNGVIRISDGRKFRVRHGTLDTSNNSDDVWRISSDETDEWLETVRSKTYAKFSHIGKIRVGVKTCADKVFIQADWHTFPKEEQPELLRPLITHHTARRYRANTTEKPWQILYTHETVNGKRQVVDLSRFPKSEAYLTQHKMALEDRRYVLEAGRQWYEIWVPQDPSRWEAPKLVFRDISERPVFWIDQSGAVVNGDCYWITVDKCKNPDLLWLAVGIANSSFIEEFYDHRFNNKLYAGRRRFITQYVEEFPLPNPETNHAKRIIELSKEAHELLSSNDAKAVELEHEIDKLVWLSFGLPIKEISG